MDQLCKISECLKQVLPPDRDLSALTPEANLVEYGLESLRAVQLVVLLEEVFSFEASEGDLTVESVSTLEKIQAMVRRYTQRETAPSRPKAEKSFKKCLVLDCDGVLWGGAAAEEGVRLEQPYLAFQEEIVRLWEEGTLLALCSKNDEKTVREVFQQHPEMPLKWEQIAAYQINWERKSENFLRLSEALGINPADMAFADDSPEEALEVTLVLPEVEVLVLPREEPLRYGSLLAEKGWFLPALTQEDRLRNQFYQNEKQRRWVRSQAESEEIYLKSLDIRLTLSLLKEEDIPRVVQLSQRANRLNATGLRLTETSLKEWVSAEGRRCWCLRCQDRFGEEGLSGFALLEEQGVTGFVLSCRLLGRRIEDVFLEWCAGRCKSPAFSLVRTGRNQGVEELLRQHGFFEKEGCFVREAPWKQTPYPIAITIEGEDA